MKKKRKNGVPGGRGEGETIFLLVPPLEDFFVSADPLGG